MSEHAYFAKKEGKILSLNNVYLKRALAKINFIQKGSDMSGTSGIDIMGQCNPKADSSKFIFNQSDKWSIPK